MGDLFWTAVLLMAVVAVILGTTRAVQFVMNDRLTKPIRDRIIKRGGYLAYGIQCPWCTSLQISLLMVLACLPAAFDLLEPAVVLWPVVILVALAVAGTLSLFAVLIDRAIDRTPLLADDPSAVPEDDHGDEPAPGPVADAFRAAADRR